MMETLIVATIVAVAAGVLIRRGYAALTCRDNVCGGVCACSAPKTADCNGCSAVRNDQHRRMP